MRLARFISKTRVIDLKSSVLSDALEELLEVSYHADMGLSLDDIHNALLDRERSMTTYLGNGVALPHIRIPMKRPYLFAIGRCPDGLEYEGTSEYREVRLVFLLLASNKDPNYLVVLSSLANTLQNEETVSYLVDAPSPEDFKTRVKETFSGASSQPLPSANKFNHLVARSAEKMASGADCSTIMLFGDTFVGPLDVGKTLNSPKTILVTSADTPTDSSTSFDQTISVRSFSRSRLAQLKSAVLIALSRNILDFSDKICCVTGVPRSNQLDTVTVVDIQKEFQAFFSKQSEVLPADVKPEVLERVLAIATELSIEGREGKAVGCLFIIGDGDSLRDYSKPLVLNPFYGYPEEERNILNPFMDETVKEYSTIDGAFIIRGNGVLDSAGTLIHAPEFNHNLPSGLGSRHAAASAISQAADCLAVTVSASTRHVTIFRKGQMLPLM